MESLSSNTEERELQQMRLEERILHPNCMAWFKELKLVLAKLGLKALDEGYSSKNYVRKFLRALTYHKVIAKVKSMKSHKDLTYTISDDVRRNLKVHKYDHQGKIPK
ncbi:hypothetical protein Tco_0470890 [Tanacetum coccineum]